MTKGLFIAIEGIDGAGKTTCARLLANSLISQSYPVTLTKEPGSTEVGAEIRHLILNWGNDTAPETQLALMLADRVEHLNKVVRPALEAGNIVICDRYSASTIAYQGYGLGLPLPLVQRANTLATRGLMPDLTFFFDVPPERSEERRVGKECRL